MAQSMDPIQSFAYLVDNVPQWLKKLEELNSQCDEQYERFFKLTRHGEVKLTRKKKHDSTESLRPNDTLTVPFVQTEETKENIPAPAISTTAVLTEASPSTLPALIPPVTSKQHTLKRKPTTALSATSAADGYRTKAMIIVYYDSAIQEGFEGIVKDVSNARSNLRKGRNSVTFQVRMASMGLSSDIDPRSPNAKSMLPSLGREKENSSNKERFKSYDEADRDLEEVQSLSERAAHQFLRDGDCKSEMRAIKRRLGAVHQVAEEELERLRQKEKAEHVDTEQVNAERNDVGKVDDISIKPNTSDVKTIEQILDRAYTKVSTPIPTSKTIEVETPTSKQMHFAATGTIEVDDAASDASSMVIDLAAIRRVTRRI